MSTRAYHIILRLAMPLALYGGDGALAQNLENGQLLAERWCAACHAVGPGATKFNRAAPFAAIAAKENITTDMIAAFLLMPHATMPSFPLSQNDARDLAGFIMDMKK